MRGNFNELTGYPDFVRELIAECERAGVYSRGIESDRKQRGSSINIDCYGYDESQQLAVIQVRQCVFHPRRFNQVRKDYYLIGRTEQGKPFAHPIDSPSLSRKIQTESAEATVRRVLARIWDCDEDDLADIVRQGDVAFIPSALPASARPVLDENGEPVREITIRETHKIIVGLRGSIFKSGETYYVARAAKAVHTKRQHATVKLPKAGGFYRVQAGIRASVWGFTRPMGD